MRLNVIHSPIITNIVNILISTLKRFRNDRCDIEARSLSFITLLIVVPFITLIVKGLMLAGVYDFIYPLITDKITLFFIPDQAEKIVEYIRDFKSIGKNIGAINFVLVFIISFWLFFLIINNVNRIWRIRKKVGVLIYFLKYIMFISIIPSILLILFYFQHFSSINKYLGISFDLVGSKPAVNIALSMFFHGVLLLFLFYIVPHRKLNFFYSALSALVSGVLLWFARLGYNVYLKNFSQMNVIYGSLVFIPILLIWIYISWLILLFGLELNYSFHTEIK